MRAHLPRFSGFSSRGGSFFPSALKEIAVALHLSPCTVETHKYDKMRALRVDTTAALIRFALEHAEPGIWTRLRIFPDPTTRTFPLAAPYFYGPYFPYFSATGQSSPTVTSSNPTVRKPRRDGAPAIDPMADHQRPRVVLADDHPAVAHQLHDLLEPEFEVVATVGDGNALVVAAAAHRPNVIVTDLAMPGLDGIAATRLIRADDPNTRIVVVTVHQDARLVACGLAAGALGFVAKVDAGDDLVRAVRAAIRGERFVSARAGNAEPDRRAT
jgi:DNA-binding NarL/FixJ family response regulator